MKVFISYCFNNTNKWIEELVFPLVEALGFQVVTGQRLDGDILVDGVEARLRDCTGCIAFTTRRSRREDGSFETHPWVVSELTKARALNFKTLEIREEGVRIGDDAEAYVWVKYRETERDQMLVALAQKLASWKAQRVRVQLVPPDEAERDFLGRVARRRVKCIYEIQLEGRVIGTGEATIFPMTGGCFIDLDVPPGDVLLQVSVKKEPENEIAWASLYTGLLAIPVQLH